MQFVSLQSTAALIVATAVVAFAFKVLPSRTKSQVSQRVLLHFFIPTIFRVGLMLVCVGAGAGSLDRISLLRKFGGRL